MLRHRERLMYTASAPRDASQPRPPIQRTCQEARPNMAAQPGPTSGHSRGWGHSRIQALRYGGIFRHWSTGPLVHWSIGPLTRVAEPNKDFTEMAPRDAPVSV